MTRRITRTVSFETESLREQCDHGDLHYLPFEKSSHSNVRKIKIIIIILGVQNIQFVRYMLKPDIIYLNRVTWPRHFTPKTLHRDYIHLCYTSPRTVRTKSFCAFYTEHIIGAIA